MTLKRSHAIVKFCDMGDAEDFRLPQCRCGKLTSRHYEIYSSNINRKKPYVVSIICEDCFDKWLLVYNRKE